MFKSKKVIMVFLIIVIMFLLSGCVDRQSNRVSRNLLTYT